MRVYILSRLIGFWGIFYILTHLQISLVARTRNIAMTTTELLVAIANASLSLIFKDNMNE